MLALHLAGRYMATTTSKFTLRLGADLWWIIYIGLRDILTVQVFLGSFIFFYPDVVKARDLPVTGGIAAVCAFAVLVIKLMTKGDADRRGYRWQIVLLAHRRDPLHRAVPPRRPGYAAARARTCPGSSPLLVSSSNPDLAPAARYLSAALVGIMGTRGRRLQPAPDVRKRPAAAPVPETTR